MKKILFTIALAATLMGCKKSPHNDQISDETKLSPDIEFSITGARPETPPLHQPSNTYNYLGYGYDVTDQFDSESSVRANVINVAAYNTLPYSVNISREGSGSTITVLGKNAVDLSERLSNRVEGTQGGILFGNTLKASFPETNFADLNYVYGYYSFYMISKTFRIYYDNEVNGFLSEEFKKDILSLSAEQLVERYGTHVLTWIHLGAKIDVLYQAKATKGDKEKIAMEGQRYALKNTFGLPSGYADNVDLSNLNANSSAKIYYNSIGGEKNKLQIQTATNNKNKRFINITDWIRSATDDNARFISVSWKGIEPIYSFIDDKVKKEEVKTYMEKYLVDKAVKLTN